MLFKTFISIFWCVIIVSDAFALSEAEYQKMYKNSEYFREADQELSATWKDITQQLNAKEKKEILKQQREWLKSERDEDAKELMAKGFSKECAYTRAAKRRTGNLKVYLYNNTLSKEDKEAGKIRPDDYYYDEDDDIVPPECKK